MVRLMLVLAPIMCILAGIAVSHLLTKFIKEAETKPPENLKKRGKVDGMTYFKQQMSTIFITTLCTMMITYTFHCTWVTSEAYSSPRYCFFNPQKFNRDFTLYFF